MGGVLERLADLGAEALHPCEAPPSGDVPLSEIKRRVGDRLCIVGNVQIGDIIHGTRQDVDERVREAVRDGAPGGGLILSTSASPYQEELAPQALDNYVQLVESGHRYSANTEH
jgi:uroporphyrinogen decarboxylase